MSVTYSANSEPTAAAAARENCYIGPPAAAVEVMREQLDYLLAHVTPNCLPGCRECMRLAKIRRYLLRPFLE